MRLQGFAWHVEYVPVWKRTDYNKPKSKPKPPKPVEKHEWIDWSQFEKFQHKYRLVSDDCFIVK